MARRIGRSLLIGRTCLARAGQVQTLSVLTRERLPNGLLPRPAANGGGFAFSGVTCAASSFATGGEEREPLCCVRVAPGSDIIVRALCRFSRPTSQNYSGERPTGGRTRRVACLLFHFSPELLLLLRMQGWPHPHSGKRVGEELGCSRWSFTRITPTPHSAVHVRYTFLFW